MPGNIILSLCPLGGIEAALQPFARSGANLGAQSSSQPCADQRATLLDALGEQAIGGTGDAHLLTPASALPETEKLLMRIIYHRGSRGLWSASPATGRVVNYFGTWFS